MENNNELKTGTTTIGIVCKDGIILAADKRATSGNFIVNKHIDKIYSVSDTMALTMAGTVSDAQLLTRLITAEIKLKDIRTNKRTTVTEAANLLAGMVYQNIRKMSMIPGVSHFVLGGSDDTGFYLFDLFADGSITKVEDYISSGSGSVMAYGVLETLYKKDMTMDQGVKLVVQAVNAALQRDSASGGGIDVMTITSEGIKRVVAEKLEGRVHIQN
jgi:proteasome beta subunit|tara:strand:- start:7 stop:654 length:648 start_codon:yes stop_codon:yes gene_type:complete